MEHSKYDHKRVESVLNAYSDFKREQQKGVIRDLDQLITSWNGKRNFHFKKTFEALDSIIPDWGELSVSYEQLNKRESLEFNPLHFFTIHEPTHSKILAHLLNPLGSHGQGASFLQLFLEMLEIQDYDADGWTVVAETANVDILIRRHQGDELGSVIVIENKCHGAKDQLSQLYRYWRQEIFFPNRNRPKEWHCNSDRRGRYRVVYLPADIHKIATSQSWERDENNPLENGAQDVSESVPEHIRDTRTFKGHVLPWIEKSKELVKENLRLRVFLEYYSELIQALK